MEDYEKKYKEALKRAKNYSKGHTLDVNPQAAMEYVFPELKENEDEKIRKALIDFVEQYGHKYYGAIARASAISWLEKQNHDGKKWIYEDVYIKEKEQVFQDGIDEVLENPQKYGLEKQGEQKPADKVEPKFKVGDWIISSEGKLRHIVDVDKTGYQTDNGWLSHEHYEKRFHLWTIQDAKDGDVLLFEGFYNSIVLFQGIGINGKGRINYHCKCDLGNYSFDVQGDVACLGTVEKDAEHYHPATKEQRDLLFQKMKEAGYEWDAEKKELRKIEKNHVWSEEDESNLQGIIDEIEANKHSAPDYDLATYDRFLSWLQSLKDRLKGE